MSTSTAVLSPNYPIQDSSTDLQDAFPHVPSSLMFASKNKESFLCNAGHSYKGSTKIRRRHKNRFRKKESKSWHRDLYKIRICRDRSFYQARKDMLSELSSDVESDTEDARDTSGSVGDILDTFLGNWDRSIPSWEAKIVKSFCSSDRTQTSAMRGFETWAWMDDREFSSGRSRSYPEALSASDLCKILQQNRYDEPGLPNSDRRLIYISKLTPAFILALAETAWTHQVEAVRDAIWKHIAIETSFRVHIPMSGFLSFHLEFHLAHFVLRHVENPAQQGASNGNNENLPIANLDFLAPHSTSGDLSSSIVYQAHISIVVCGWSNNQWTGYAFANTGLPEVEFEAQDELKHDFFAADREDDFVKDADMPTWDARKYWLQIVAIRCELILKEWMYLVRLVEEGIENSKANDPCSSGTAQANLNPTDVQRSLTWAIQTMQLLRKLRDSLSSTLRAHRRFSEPGGDLGYFSDVSDCFTITNSIKETFEKLADLYAILNSLDESCTRFATHLGRILSSESNRLTAESNELSKHSNQLNAESVKLNEESRNLNVRASALNDKLRELNEKSADAACANVAAAAKTSRSTRVNVELLLFTAPFGMVLQYFGSDTQVFAIERSPTAFIVATLILMLILRILTLLLEHAEALIKMFTPKKFARSTPQDPAGNSQVELLPIQPV